jgi:diguanylate cyclase (GGDEF)-like protein
MSPAVERFLHYDISYFSVFFLVVVLLAMWYRRDRSGFGARLFGLIVAVTILMTLTEVGSWVFDSRPGPTQRMLNIAANWIYGWLTPLSGVLWACYLDFQVFRSRERLRRRQYYAHAMIVSTVVMIANLFFPIVSTVSPDNVYTRQAGVWVLYAATAATILAVIISIFRNRNRVTSDVVYVLSALAILPLAAAGVQLSVYGMLLLWPSMTVVVVLAYVFLENHNASIDYLTGIYNRRRVDEHVRHLIESGTTFSIVTLDLDDFKLINDTMGHAEGDQVLCQVADVLGGVARGRDLAARFGGDEFAFVTRRITSEGALQEVIASIRSRFESGERSYPILASSGGAIWRPGSGETVDELYSRVDTAMYADKAARKNQRRRRDD